MHTSIGPYRVIDYVGAGGMGTVYRVSHRITGRVAAAKIMGGGAVSPRSLERFRNEARILQALTHPAIAGMYEFLDVNGSPCLVMEYVDGDTVEHRLRTLGPLPLAEAIRVFTALVDAVGYIHQRGIVHRDLKTNNVKIDSAGAVKLLDFGIATAEGTPRLTSTGNVVGTLMSLAPEQLRTGRAEPRSDIWALGILFYEMVTGRPPFEGEAPGILSDRIMRGIFSPASDLRPDLPRDVDRIIGRCLRVRPDDRYATAEALLTELRALQSGEKLVNTPIEFFRTSGEIATVIARQWRLAVSGALAVAAIVFFLWSLRSPSTSNSTPGGGTQSSVVIPRASGAARSGDALRPPPSERDVLGPAGGALTSADSMSRRPLIIRVLEGTAEVYIDNVRVGTTPYTLKASPGTEMQLVLRRPGCDDLRRSLRMEEGMQETVESLPNCRAR